MNTESLEKIISFMGGSYKANLIVALDRTKDSPVQMSLAFANELESYTKQKRIPEVLSFLNGCLFSLAILNAEKQHKKLFLKTFEKILTLPPDNVIPISRGRKKIGVTQNGRDHA